MIKEIFYVYRKPGISYSIEHVFQTLEMEMVKYCSLHNIYLPYAKVSLKNFLRNMFYVRRLCKGIVHLTGDVHYTILLCKRNVILTVHDLRFIDFESGIRRKIFELFWLYLPIRKATYVTCISNLVRNRLVECFPFCENKIRVIYNPIDPNYQYVPKKFNDKYPVILHIGTAENKNLEHLIEAIHGISCKLRIVGNLKRNLEEKLRLYKIDYSCVNNLSDEEIRSEYVDCDIVSFPSLYEGFGMPIIEGQATGRVVITSDLEPMKEIAGDAAVLINPYNVRSIREGLMNIIMNECERNRLIQKGLENVRRFELSFIARQYIELYRECN